MGERVSLEFELTDGAFQLSADGFHPERSADGDFWRAFLDTGEIRELSVYSHAQTPKSVVWREDGMIVHYDSLTAENDEHLEIALSVHIHTEDGALRFTAEIDNRSKAIVNELQLPYLCARHYACKPEEEILYAPEALGRRTYDPRTMMQKEHTEYMSADYKSVTYARDYPNCLSIPWLGLKTGEYYLYLGEHDEELKLVSLNVHASPREAVSELGFSISHYPAVQPGEKLSCCNSVLALFKGDWRDGAAFYRTWAESTWYPDPHARPDWVRGITGWQRIICKHQYGEIFFRYEDLPRVYEEGKAVGLNALLVFGWWKGRFDNNYPELEPDPALGGTQALRDAVKKIQDDGGRVLLYSNGNLIDIKTDFYKTVGHRICAKDIDGKEYREHYRFSNDGTVLRLFGYKSFVTGCHCEKEWQERLLYNARLKRSFGVDSVFFDQLGCCVKLCFDKSHSHGARIDRETGARLDNIRAIREILSQDEAIGTEFVNDRYAAAADYIHGCGNSCSFVPDAYPDLYMDTFKGTVVSNRFLHDERPDFKAHLNYTFVSGMIFDVSIFRGRVCGIAGQPQYAAHLKYLLDLKVRYARYFYRGSFFTLEGSALPKGIRAGAFRAEDSADWIAALWNETDRDISFTLSGCEITVPAGEVSVQEYLQAAL